MSQGDGFTGGFLAGAVLGGVLGGVIGAVVASYKTSDTSEPDASLLKSSPSEAKLGRARRRHFKGEDSIEASRRSLEDKIAQLNAAIDEVRLSLGTVNGNAAEAHQELSLTQEPLNPS